MPERLGSDHEVGLAAHERGRERVPEHVGGHVVLEAGAVGDAGDHVVRASGAEPLASLVEEQRGGVAGARPAGAFVEPFAERRAELLVDPQLADAFARASALGNGSVAGSALVGQARYWRTFEAYVRRVCAASGAAWSAAAYRLSTVAYRPSNSMGLFRGVGASCSLKQVRRSQTGPGARSLKPRPEFTSENGRSPKSRAEGKCGSALLAFCD